MIEHEILLRTFEKTKISANAANEIMGSKKKHDDENDL